MNISLDLLQHRFDLKPNQKLAYSPTGKKFAVVNRDAPLLPEGFSTNLRVIRRAVDACLKQQAEFDAVQAINVNHNIEVVHNIYDSYNNAVYEYRILRLLDKILRIVTFGFFRLIFSYHRGDYRSDAFELLETLNPKNVDKVLDYFIDDYIKDAELRDYFLLRITQIFPKLSDEQKSKTLTIFNKYSYGKKVSWNIVEILDHLIIKCQHLELSNLRNDLCLIFPDLMYKNLTSNAKSLLPELLTNLTFDLNFKFVNIPWFVVHALQEEGVDSIAITENSHRILLFFLSAVKIYSEAKIYEADFEKVMVQLFKNGFTLNREKIPQDLRAPFLKALLALSKKSPLIKDLADLMYPSFGVAYKDLTQAEKTEFLKLACCQDPAKMPRQIFFDLIGSNIAFTNEQFQKFFEAARNFPTLQPAEMTNYLVFLDPLKLDDLSIAQKALALYLQPQRFKQVFELLLSKPKMLEHCPRFAVNFVFAISQMKDVKKNQVQEILQSIKLAKFSKEQFHILTRSDWPLAKIFNEDPERYLATASEEQLILYYSKMEEGLKLNYDHIKIKISTNVDAPPLPPGVKVDLADIVTMYDQINFTQKSKPNYVDPNSLLDDGELVSVSCLRNAINVFIDNVKKKTIPYAPTDPIEKERFHNNVFLYLAHSTIALQKRKPEERSAHIIAFGMAGLHCAAQYLPVALDCYHQTTGANYCVEGETVIGGVLKLLANFRSGILNKVISENSSQGVYAHSYALLKKKVGERFNVADVANFQYYDHVRPEYVHFADELEQLRLYQACLKELTSTVIINELVKHIEGLPGHPPTIKGEFREAIYSWFKDMGVKINKKKYTKAPHEYLSDTVFHPETNRIRRAHYIQLLQNLGSQNNVFAPPPPPEKSWRNLWGRLS